MNPANGTAERVGMGVTMTEHLRSHMQPLGLTSFRALAEAADVSEWQIRQLRQGKIDNMRLTHLKRIAIALRVQLSELLSWTEPDFCSSPQSDPSQSELSHSLLPADPPTQASKTQVSSGASAEMLQQECDRLQQQLDQQQATLLKDFQRNSLYQLEAWMKNWPRVVHVVQTQNPELPAAKILALVSPLKQLLQQWNVETIGTIGERLTYDPTQHNLMGSANPGDLVEVTRPGYRHEDALLHRADVKAI